VPVLPLIDLLILLAWSCLIVAFAEKAIWLALASKRFILFGMTPFDWVVAAAVFLLFALALAARVWVKTAEPALLRLRVGNGRGVEVLPDFPDPREALAHHDEDEEPIPRRFGVR
jgi:hypothetical protein